MRFYRPWFIVRWLYSDAVFRIKTNDRVCCLTFDDGPHPESTEGLLEILEKFDAKAVFFCTGMAAGKYPSLVDMIKSRGHLVGNHGYAHLNGFITKTKRYLEDVDNAARFTSSKIFRPPYGCLAPKQYLKLNGLYRIIFWDVMPYDFDRNLDPDKSIAILKQKLRPGSIIVLHDTPGQSLEITRRFLEYARSTGYRYVLLS